MERIEINLYTVEQLQLQSLVESGLIEDKDLVFAKSIATAPNATPIQLKWVKTLLDKLIGEPPVRYEFTALFNSLNIIKTLTTEFQGSPLRLNLAGTAAKYPGAIYLVSQKSGLGYVGRIDMDHSVVIPKRCEAIKESLIKFLMDLNSDPGKFVRPIQPKQAVFGAALMTTPVNETLQQQVARGPFDPVVMNALLNEYGKEFNEY